MSECFAEFVRPLWILRPMERVILRQWPGKCMREREESEGLRTICLNQEERFISPERKKILCEVNKKFGCYNSVLI